MREQPIMAEPEICQIARELAAAMHGEAHVGRASEEFDIVLKDGTIRRPRRQHALPRPTVSTSDTVHARAARWFAPSATAALGPVLLAALGRGLARVDKRRAHEHRGREAAAQRDLPCSRKA